MSVVVNPTAIVNEALARIGSQPIFALDEETSVARKVAQIYPTIVGAAFAANRWKFARRTRQLSRLAGTPETGWKYAYALPGDREGEPVRVLHNPRQRDNPLRNFEVEGDEVHCDAEAVWATCILQVDPSHWPALFKNAVVVALAAELAVPQAHDRDLANDLRVQAWGTPSEGKRGGLIGVAMARDAAQSGESALLASDPLTASRYDGPWYGNA